MTFYFLNGLSVTGSCELLSNSSSIQKICSLSEHTIYLNYLASTNMKVYH